MDITRDNFIEKLPFIEETIKNSDFVSIDCELSGLRKGKAGALFDEHDERFTKLREGCMDYSIIELGLSCFKYNPADGKHSSMTFNVYVFPYKINGLTHRVLERNIEFQGSAIQFLRGVNFDFNHLFDKGLNWLNVDEEKEVKKSLDGYLGIATDSDRKPFIIPADQVEFVNGIIQQIEAFLNNGDNNAESKLDLPPSTPFQRKMVYEHIKASPTLRTAVQVQTKKVTPTGREQYLEVTRSDYEAKVKRSNDLLAEAVGVSKLIQFLAQYKRPIIGHNLLLDLMHVVNQLITPIPKTYAEFKELVQTLFASLYDTKFISATSDFLNLITSTALNELYEAISKEPFPNVHCCSEADFGNDTSYHQAGYDSFITGKCFIILNEFLRRKYKEGNVQAITNEMSRFANKMNVSWSFDINHLDLGLKALEVIDRRHVFYVSFPETWSTNDLLQLFSAYGHITIGWLGSSSALIGLRDSTQWKEVEKSLKNLTGDSVYRILSYEDYLRNVKSVSAADNKASVSEESQVKRKIMSVEVATNESDERTKSQGLKKNKTEDKKEKTFETCEDW